MLMIGRDPTEFRLMVTTTAFQPRIIDTESIPDGRLLRLVKYAEHDLTDEQAVERARQEARENSHAGSDFLPVTFQVPVSVCVARVARDFSLEKITCLDAPRYRPREIVKQFWSGMEKLNAKLVTFNGRGFDMPLLELAGYRYGCAALSYFQKSRNRYSGSIDLMDWFTNYGAYRMAGGLNLLAKLLGLPGKMEVAGDQVYELYRQGRYQDINDYCMCDTLDTYFIFLRTRVMVGEMTQEREAELIGRARDYLTGRVGELPALKQYLESWAAGGPWP
jgi:predicted PolB exonuclease-like 3'-5' exonuclease